MNRSPLSITIVLDCGDATRLARFWSAALGYVIGDPLEQFVNEVVTRGLADSCRTADVLAIADASHNAHLDVNDQRQSHTGVDQPK